MGKERAAGGADEDCKWRIEKLIGQAWRLKNLKNENELLIPPGAEEDPRAMEVIRVWVAKGGQHVSLNPLVWKDPQAWGIVLADLAGHVANAYEQALGLDRGETMRKITDLLLAELTNPTDSARGQMQNTRPRHRRR